MSPDHLVIGFVQGAVLAALRDGLLPTPEEVEALDTDAALQRLAGLVAQEDLTALKRAGASASPRVRAWAHDLASQAEALRELGEAEQQDVARDALLGLGPEPARPCAYFARCMTRQLRAGAAPSAQDAARLNCQDVMAWARVQVAEEDLDWVWRGTAAPDPQVSAFFVGLLRDHADRLDAGSRLRELWEGASPEMRAQLMWRILDDPDLPLEWHHRIFDFVMDHWRLFAAVSTRYLGGDDAHVIARAMERLADPTYLATKKWASLCSAAAVTGYPAALSEILAIGESSELPFMRHVAIQLRDRIELAQ